MADEKARALDLVMSQLEKQFGKGRIEAATGFVFEHERDDKWAAASPRGAFSVLTFQRCNDVTF